MPQTPKSFFFFFNDTATTEIYTLSLHDALPICLKMDKRNLTEIRKSLIWSIPLFLLLLAIDRKSTRLNSSHLVISYAVFCLKKKTTTSYNNIASDNNRRRLICAQLHPITYVVSS